MLESGTQKLRRLRYVYVITPDVIAAWILGSPVQCASGADVQSRQHWHSASPMALANLATFHSLQLALGINEVEAYGATWAN